MRVSYYVDAYPLYCIDDPVSINQFVVCLRDLSIHDVEFIIIIIILAIDIQNFLMSYILLQILLRISNDVFDSNHVLRRLSCFFKDSLLFFSLSLEYSIALLAFITTHSFDEFPLYIYIILMNAVPLLVLHLLFD